MFHHGADDEGEKNVEKTAISLNNHKIYNLVQPPHTKLLRLLHSS